MADIVSKENRSRMMAGIRSKNTRPELLVRKGLFAKGLRYSLHRKDLPGKPDLTFPKHHAVIFIHGCFWHMHGCHLFKWPSSKVDFWRTKLQRNISLDTQAVGKLRERGFRICIIWECALKGKYRISFESVIQNAFDWLHSENNYLEIKGYQ